MDVLKWPYPNWGNLSRHLSNALSLRQYVKGNCNEIMKMTLLLRLDSEQSEFFKFSRLETPECKIFLGAGIG